MGRDQWLSLNINLWELGVFFKGCGQSKLICAAEIRRPQANPAFFQYNWQTPSLPWRPANPTASVLRPTGRYPPIVLKNSDFGSITNFEAAEACQEILGGGARPAQAFATWRVCSLAKARCLVTLGDLPERSRGSSSGRGLANRARRLREVGCKEGSSGLGLIRGRFASLQGALLTDSPPLLLSCEDNPPLRLAARGPRHALLTLERDTMRKNNSAAGLEGRQGRLNGGRTLRRH